MNTIPNTSNSAVLYRGHVIRRIGAKAWQVRKDNGSGWGNGDLLNVCTSKRRAVAFVDGAAQ